MSTKKVPKTRDQWDTIVKDMEKEERLEAEQFRKRAEQALSRQHRSNNPFQSLNPIPTMDELKDIPADFGYTEEDKKQLENGFDHAHFLCSHCRRVYMPHKQLLCLKCKEAWYCSKGCASTAWTSYHKRQCATMDLQTATQERIWKNWLSEVEGRDEAILNAFCITRHDTLVPLHPDTKKPMLSDSRDLIPVINAQEVDEKIAAAPKDSPAAFDEIDKLLKIISIPEWKHLALIGRVPLSISRWFETRDKSTEMLAMLHRDNKNVLMKISVDPNRHNRKTIPKHCECLECETKRTPHTNTKTKQPTVASTTDYGSCDISLENKTEPSKKNHDIGLPTSQITEEGKEKEPTPPLQEESNNMHEYDSENDRDIEIAADNQNEIEIREKEQEQEQEQTEQDQDPDQDQDQEAAESQENGFDEEEQEEEQSQEEEQVSEEEQSQEEEQVSEQEEQQEEEHEEEHEKEEQEEQGNQEEEEELTEQIIV